MKTRQKIYLFFKRFFDIFCSFLAIVILSPLLLIISLIIKIDSRGPVLFKQDRIGKNKKIFKMWKFRSMRIDAPKNAPTHMLDNPDLYITKIGKFIRKTSIDELPQLFNVLTGKMSIIGPRPALWNQDDLVSERDKYHANDIRPGLSGWAQVNGRDELEIPVKAKLDGYYYQKFSLWLDIKILFMTIFKVFKHDGIVEGKHEETEKEKELNEKVGS